MELRPHDLVRLGDLPRIVDEATPPWVTASLAAYPWAVIRRCRARPGEVAIGIRGVLRAQRFAITAPRAAVVETITPEALASARAWRHAPRRATTPALAMLPDVAAIIERSGWCWGPTGGAGFELATGAPVLHAASDLDLVVRADVKRRHALAVLAAELAGVGVRVDVQVEIGDGAVALAELARGGPQALLRTSEGPRLVRLAA